VRDIPTQLDVQSKHVSLRKLARTSGKVTNPWRRERRWQRYAPIARATPKAPASSSPTRFPDTTFPTCPLSKESSSWVLFCTPGQPRNPTDKIVGILRGQADKLQSLFVQGDRHRQGIGRRLVERFEQTCLRQGTTAIRVQATLYAVAFYLNMGYKRSTGVRCMRIFGGTGFRYQPMKKVLTATTTVCPSPSSGL
jgi:GNAT superfamily N-acetyltransferase